VLSPQHFTVRTAVTAQLCFSPAATEPFATALGATSVASTGAVGASAPITTVTSAPVINVRVLIALLPSSADLARRSEKQSHEPVISGHFSM
jgi:hypothetical protein